MKTLPPTQTIPENRQPAWSLDPIIGLRVFGSLTEFELPASSDSFSVGRGSGCDVRLDSRAVSKVHCTLERQAGRLVVDDRRSKNGVIVDGAPRGMFELMPATVFVVGDVPLIAFSSGSQHVRARLQRFLGYDIAHQQLVDLALTCIARRRSVLIVAPPGCQAQKLARFIHEAGPGAGQPLVDAADAVLSRKADQARLLRRAAHGTLVVPALAMPRDRTLFQDSLAADTYRIRTIAIAQPEDDAMDLLGPELFRQMEPMTIPPLVDRRGDFIHLVPVILTELAARFGSNQIDAAIDMPALLRHDWPGNLDELEGVLGRLLAIRAQGSVRKAAAVLGVSKSNLARWAAEFLGRTV